MATACQELVSKLSTDCRIRIGYTPAMGNRLNEIRLDRRLSLEQLANRVVPPTTKAQISRLEKGDRKLTREWADRLAVALGCNWAELMGADVPQLSPDEIALLENYRGMSEPTRQTFRSLSDTLAKSDSGQNDRNNS